MGRLQCKTAAYSDTQQPARGYSDEDLLNTSRPRASWSKERGRIWRMKISEENGYHLLQYENYILQTQPQPQR
jgi:hypothetical protein